MKKSSMKSIALKRPHDELFPYSLFPYRLQTEEDKETRIAWFQCEDHLIKHLTRYRITEGDSFVLVADGSVFEYPGSKPKRKAKATPKAAPKATKAAPKAPKATKSKATASKSPTKSKTKGKAFSELDTFFTK